ncbi:hypothetical protein R1sor_000087 [Riccia sorocarpa]|uniref:protein-tyrosine-phosphatase n=1 Tax=Riccia sorocarpa TaxID=122646 RepID=A0ABD3GS39_9MARC
MMLVREGLYIGNINDGTAVFQGKHPNITHMLSVLSSQILYQASPKTGDPYSSMSLGPGEHVQSEQDETAVIETIALSITPDSTEAKSGDAAKKGGRVFTRMTVPLKDMESENLLDHLEACMDFIEKGRKTGSVLVHCMAGVSRSAAVILAYLMRTERLSVEDALTSLRESSATACPNSGFMDQLQMFEDMGFKVDHGSSIYKKFHVFNLGEAYGKGEKIESSRFASDPGEASSSLIEDLVSKLCVNGVEKSPMLYRCRKCRRLVASESNVVTHNLGLGESSFKTKRKASGRCDDYGEPKCSSIFVEPMKWMTAVVQGDVEGKLLCATCEARLGNFNWAGLQCSCGAWVNPAFQLHKSRMDLTWL